MKIICDLTDPCDGTITLNGESRDIYCKRIGYLPQHFSYYPQFTGLEFMEYMCHLKGVKRSATRNESINLLKRVGLDDVREKKIGLYSGGMKQRIGIAQALINNPDLIILDEPTVGLDPEERVKFRHIISLLGKDKIVILSTHIVSDLEAISKEIILLKDCQFLFHGNQETLLSILEGKIWEMSSSINDIPKMITQEQIISEKIEGGQITLRFISETKPEIDCHECRANLEDLYLYHFREVK